MKKTNVLAVCSGGGHLEQMLCIKEAFGEVKKLSLCTTIELSERDLSSFSRVYLVPDCNRDQVFNVMKCFLKIVKIIILERPKVIVTTGAAPGLLAIVVGRLFNVKTIWIDSVANAERLSLSGKLAGKLAHLWLTQWPHLEKKNGPFYWGNVL